VFAIEHGILPLDIEAMRMLDAQASRVNQARWAYPSFCAWVHMDGKEGPIDMAKNWLGLFEQFLSVSQVYSCLG
jgi:hypothetical protein